LPPISGLMDMRREREAAGEDVPPTLAFFS